MWGKMWGKIQVNKNKTPQNQAIKRGFCTRGGTRKIGFTPPHKFLK
jgi:hypothetical protein